MKSLKKRVATAVLAGTMAMSLAVPAFAANTTTKVTASYAPVEIAVTVPETGTVTINPLGLPVKLGEKSTDKSEVKALGPFVTAPMVLSNDSKDVDLKVGATVTGTVKGNFKFAETGWATNSAPTTNSGFVYLKMVAGTANTAKTAVDPDGVLTTLGAVAADTTLTTADTVKAATEKTDGTAIIVLSTKATSNATLADGTKCYIGELKAKKDAGYQDESFGICYLNGQVVEEPNTAWATSDGFSATIAFTFKATAVKG